MFKKWIETIFNHKISLRERMFRVITGICMIALIIILPMGRKLINLLILGFFKYFDFPLDIWRERCIINI